MVSGGQSKWWSTPVGESGQIVEQMGDAMAADMCKQVWDDKQAINLSQIYDDDEIFELEPTEGGGLESPRSASGMYFCSFVPSVGTLERKGDGATDRGSATAPVRARG
jgi:hypothetical protein